MPYLGIKTAIQKCTKTTSKMTSQEERHDPATRAMVENELKKVKKHFIGDHSECEFNGEHCNSLPVFREYPGKFSQSQVDALVNAIFDKKYTSKKFIDQILDAGCTSINEAFHSMLVNRRLVVKGKYDYFTFYLNDVFKITYFTNYRI